MDLIEKNNIYEKKKEEISNKNTKLNRINKIVYFIIIIIIYIFYEYI